MRRTLAVLVVTALAAMALFAASPAMAQGGLDYRLPPSFGQLDLTSNFRPDPQEVTLVGGGPVNISSELEGVCIGHPVGFAASAPDFRLNYTVGDYILRISFAGQGDTTLVVSAPDGSWYCDDDSGGMLQPMLHWGEPLSGQYDIWVGTSNPNETSSGTLFISETLAMPGVDFTDRITLPPLNLGTVSGPKGGPATSGLPITVGPSYGSTEITGGFADDPFFMEMTAGGPVDVSSILGTTCTGNATGFVNSKPAFRVDYTASNYPLTFFFYNMDEEDTTMVVQAPNGQYYCDDDSAGLLQPAVTFQTPASGSYYVWLGTYSQDNYAWGWLLITETDMRAQEVADAVQGNQPSSTGSLDYTLAPAYGAVTLQSNFMPDPQTLDMLAGGSVDVYSAVGSACQGSAGGYAAAAPDLRLNYTAGSYPLRIFFVSDADTTLIVSDPAGRWYCNDDAAGTLNPMIEFNPPTSGQYDIWVGTYSQGDFAQGTLYITEMALDPSTAGGPAIINPPGASTGGLDYTLAPAYGTVTLQSNFTPDPQTLDMLAGGSVNVSSAIGSACQGSASGYAAAAPDLRLNYTAGQYILRILFVGNADTTLIVSDPTGRWYCNDDAAGTLHPMIEFSPPTSGQYDIWVGTYSQGDYSQGRLYITEMALDPSTVGGTSK